MTGKPAARAVFPKGIGDTIIRPYSDFPLHDVGTGDGIPQAAKPEYLDQSTANKFRTPPLWACASAKT
ncbi:MAG TPA: di-heme oxidoredictase family protein [Candidatus Dormibacteraeota bacterium]|nr:di-heme oxidoredictase family protein [Candidatus Dormibacteraeota bacterium]